MKQIKFVYIFLFIILLGNLRAQTEVIQDAKSYIFENITALGLSMGDVEEMKLSDTYFSKHNGSNQIFFQQVKNDIPVFNALMNVTITKSGKVIVTANRFIPEIESKIKRSTEKISPEMAISKAVLSINPSADRNIKARLLEKINDKHFLFEGGTFSNTNINVRKLLVPDKENNLYVCWNLELDKHESADYWNMSIHTGNGDLILKHNYTSYCSFNHNSFSHRPNPKNATKASASKQIQSLVGTPKYKVFPFPGESPNHIEHSIIENPADPLASPFGWHDDNGEEGNEYTITRGNNAHAYLDEFDQDSPSSFEPDGGDSLHFIYDFNKLSEPQDLKDAAVVNLFYTNNRLHDLIYRFGFDETSGNFQSNNYGKGGQGNDYVMAEGFDASGLDNANFSTPVDGNNGRMQMYLWEGSDNIRLEILDPLEVSGLFETGKADFGPDMDIVTEEGRVVIAIDNTNKPNLGCSTMINGDELDGNIALIDRGVCEFGSKVLNAEKAGAIAVLICNVAGVDGGTGDELILMGAGDEGEQVDIPSLFLKKTTCDLIKISIAARKEVNVKMGLQKLEGPARRAASFDNGVIAHEYAHGISTRLTGGPSNSSCLYNADVNNDGEADGEQMGEGWSDFYALALTALDGQAGEDARGIGTYVSGQLTSGRGIRHYPYSTDMGISPVTYDFIKTTNIPHGVGEVWAAVIWDMYWEFVNLYSFDPTWTDENSGNYRAMLLVTDAMKIQACNPGFLDGRDAIIDADLINYDGQHECLIWDVFAKRGMGYYAEQGDPFDHRDGKENFEPKPTCIAELKLSQEYDNTVVPGENMNMKFIVTNHKTDSVSNVLIKDELPDGLSFVMGSSNTPASVNDGILEFDLGTIKALEKKEVTFELASDPSIHSDRKFLDEMEEDDGYWISLDNINSGTFWEITDYKSKTGSFSWYVFEPESVSDVSLIMLHDPVLIDGENPALCFNHYYETEVLTDGGFIEYSLDWGDTWNNFTAKDFIINPYNGGLSYNTISIPGLEAFYGNSNGYIKSYIDLDFLKGEEVIFAFRYGSDDNTVVEAEYPGWFVDDVEIVDLKKYNLKACVQSAENDNVCIEGETLLDSRLADSSRDILAKQIKIAIGPNPSDGHLNIILDSPINEEVDFSILSLDGKEVYKNKIHALKGAQKTTYDLSHLNAGIYWLDYKSSMGNKLYKVIIQK